MVSHELENTEECCIVFAGNPLLCGCDVMWIVADNDLKQIFTSDTTCSDGETSIQSLPIEWFEANCPSDKIYSKLD